MKRHSIIAKGSAFRSEHLLAALVMIKAAVRAEVLEDLPRLAHNPRAAGTDGSTSLRILVLYANPVTASLGATLHRDVVKTLRSRGHEIDDCYLYAERFDPVMSEKERMQYHDVKLNRAAIAAYADRLLAAEALILIYPVWNEGFPAILKGFFDRVFIPGVSFTVNPDGRLVTNLQKLRKIAAVCTYGAVCRTLIPAIP